MLPSCPFDWAASVYGSDQRLVLVFATSCAVSFLVAWAIWIQRIRLLRLTRRSDLLARQATHSRPTLRLGGIGIFLGIVVVAAFNPGSPGVLQPLIIASLPIVVSGLLEDVGLSQSPRTRLAMAAVSGALALLMLEVALPHIGIPTVDLMLEFLPIAVAFTLFATTGLVHAFNLVDGLNGFASFNALVSIGGLVGLAWISSVPDLWLPAVALVGALMGFLPLNFPTGRLFLGDAGAYLIGFCLAWMAVFLVATQANLTPWAVLLVFFWPVADTFLAIARRRQRGSGAAQPDRLHAHHVMMRGVEIAIFGRKDRRRSNPLASALLVPFLLPPPITAWLVWDSPLLAAIAFLFYSILFAITYTSAIWAVRRNGRKSTRRDSGSPALRAGKAEH